MNTDLFTSLRKYRPRDGHDPLENFITEAFAWLLRSDSDFSSYFLNRLFVLLKKQNLEKPAIIPEQSNYFHWKTQQYWAGYYPDMICEIDQDVLIFEHKTWKSDLHENQLNNYENYAAQHYTNHYIILITASTRQHDKNQKYHLAICWSDIYDYINTWLLEKSCKEENTFLFKSFMNLLSDEGMGTAAPISHEAIQTYYTSRHLKQQISQLVKSCDDYDWNETLNHKDFSKKIITLSKGYYGESDGRIGINLFQTWRPNIFLGFLIDWEDHATQPLQGNASPDFSVIISFSKPIHRLYPTDDLYKKFIKKLSKLINELSDGFDFYNHLLDTNVADKNHWHPIHIRKPMLELLRGTKTREEQKQAFIEASSKILQAIASCEEFSLLREKYKGDSYKQNGSQYGWI